MQATGTLWGPPSPTRCNKPMQPKSVRNPQRKSSQGRQASLLPRHGIFPITNATAETIRNANRYGTSTGAPAASKTFFINFYMAQVPHLATGRFPPHHRLEHDKGFTPFRTTPKSLNRELSRCFVRCLLESRTFFCVLNYGYSVE